MIETPSPLPTDSAARKTYPLYRGLFLYFPRALCAVAHHSYANNEKHNPGEPLHWAKEKSADHFDCLLRHVIEGDWVAAAWRALAQLETVLEQEPAAATPASPDCPESGRKLNPADIPAPEYDPDDVAFSAQRSCGPDVFRHWSRVCRPWRNDKCGRFVGWV